MSSITKCPSAPREVNRRSLVGAGFAALLLAPRTFAFVAQDLHYQLDRAGHSISVRRRGEELRRVDSPSPAAMAVHPNGRWLYVVNAVGEYEFLPRGTVQTYEVMEDGLRLLGTTPLSLSGTFPSDIALSPDGCHAVVAIAGGGAYNVLPVTPGSGVLQAPVQIVKRYGITPDRVAFARTGRTVYGGAGEVFRFEKGRMAI